MITEREKFLMRETLKVSDVYSDIDEWLAVVVDDLGYTVEHALNSDADKATEEQAHEQKNLEVRRAIFSAVAISHRSLFQLQQYLLEENTRFTVIEIKTQLRILLDQEHVKVDDELKLVII